MARSLPQTGDPGQSDSLEFMVREVQALNQEINGLKRETRAVLGLVVTAAGLVAPLQENLDTNIAAILLPFLLVGLAAYGCNLNAEIAALAEQRDRLSEYVNRVGGTKVFLGRVISDNRRGSLGTALTWFLAGLIVIGSIGVGGFYAWPEGALIFWSFVALMTFSLAAVLSAVIDLPLTRQHVNKALDDELGDVDRPVTSPSSGQGRWDLIKSSYFGRRRLAGPTVNAPRKMNTDHWHGPASSQAQEPSVVLPDSQASRVGPPSSVP